MRRRDRRRPAAAGQGRRWGATVLGAVSADHDGHTPRQPTALRPLRLAPQGPPRRAMAAARLLQAADNIPAIVATPGQERCRRRPGVDAAILGATAQAMAGSAEALQGHHVLRRAPARPTSQAPGEPKRPIRPHAQPPGEAGHRPPLLGGNHPGQARHRRRAGRRHARVVEEEIASWPAEPCANGPRQAWLPGPFSWPSSRHAVVGPRVSRLGQGHATRRGASREPRGERAPQQRWHREALLRAVGWELYAISPPLRNPCIFFKQPLTSLARRFSHA